MNKRRWAKWKKKTSRRKSQEANKRKKFSGKNHIEADVIEIDYDNLVRPIRKRAR